MSCTETIEKLLHHIKKSSTSDLSALFEGQKTEIPNPFDNLDEFRLSAFRRIPGVLNQTSPGADTLLRDTFPMEINQDTKEQPKTIEEEKKEMLDIMKNSKAIIYPHNIDQED